MVLSCLNAEFSSTENEEPFPIKYTISRDQCQRISFVSRTVQNEEEAVAVKEDEDEDDDAQKEEEAKESVAESEETETEKEEEPQKVIEDAAPKTLIDVIVDEKVEQKLKAIQIKFDEELNEYKQQIQKLQNASK